MEKDKRHRMKTHPQEEFTEVQMRISGMISLQ
jgi:hypothetical protein